MTKSLALSQLARPLAPEQLPYYRHHTDRQHASPGWYWQPAGGGGVEYLGYTSLDAARALNAHLDQLEPA